MTASQCRVPGERKQPSSNQGPLGTATSPSQRAPEASGVGLTGHIQVVAANRDLCLYSPLGRFSQAGTIGARTENFGHKNVLASP